MCIWPYRVSLWYPLVYVALNGQSGNPACCRTPVHNDQTYDTFMQPSQTKQERPVMSALPERPKEVPIPARRTTFPGGVLYSQFQFMQGRKILKSQSWSVRRRVVSRRSRCLWEGHSTCRGTVCCGQKPQQFKSNIEAICGQRLPQLVVARVQNILIVTWT